MEGKGAPKLQEAVNLLSPWAPQREGLGFGQGAADSLVWEPLTLCPARAHNLMGSRSKLTNK